MDKLSSNAAAKPHSPRVKQRRSHRGLILLGAVLICAAVVLMVSGAFDSLRAQAASSAVLLTLDQRRPESYAVDSPSGLERIGDSGVMAPQNPVASEQDSDQGMPIERIGEYDYVGSIAIPTLGIYLPVAAQTNDARLRISPCLYSGSYLTDDLVICGEGYSSHFGSLGSVGIRDEVRFVAADGAMYRYVVSNVETDKLDDMGSIMDDWDLTIFTFNADGTCCVVRCIRT